MRGLRLIDFGRSLDTTLYQKQTGNANGDIAGQDEEHDVIFLGNSATEGFGAPQMMGLDRDRCGWREDIDLCGVAGVLHVMLFNEVR